MSKLNISVPHNLGAGEAQSRVKGLLGQLKNQFGSQVEDLQENWDGNQGAFAFKAMGMKVDGNIVVKPASVDLEGNLPMAALPFKGTIETTIKDKLQELLR